MQAIVLLIIVVVTTFEYLAEKQWAPHLIAYLPEVLSLLLVLYVIAKGVGDRFRNVRPAYWFAFGLVLVTMVCGAILNALEPGPMVSGLRMYGRSIPLFFLPMVYAFSDKQLKTQLRLLLAIALLQVPIAIGQRMGAIALGHVTGDLTSGTLIISSILSIFLICSVSVLTASFRRGEISAVLYVPLFLALIIPTTINETKGTLVLLPVALAVTLLTLAKPGTRLKNAVFAITALAVFAAIFVPIYDSLIARRAYARTVSDYIENPDTLKRYVDTGAEVGATSTKTVGRLDTIRVPLVYLAKEPSHLVFGLGIGNVSNSLLGQQFIGEYFQEFQPFMQTTFARVVMEVGLLGVVCVFWLYWLIYADCRALVRADPGFGGTLAAGWTGVVAVIALGTFYKDLVFFPSISYLFWYFSGLIAARRIQLMRQSKPSRERS